MKLTKDVSKFMYRDKKFCELCPFTKYEVDVKFCVSEQCKNLILKPEYKAMKDKIDTEYIRRLDDVKPYNIAKLALTGVKIDINQFTEKQVAEMREHKRLDSAVILPWDLVESEEKGDEGELNEEIKKVDLELYTYYVENCKKDKEKYMSYDTWLHEKYGGKTKSG